MRIARRDDGSSEPQEIAVAEPKDAHFESTATHSANLAQPLPIRQHSLNEIDTQQEERAFLSERPVEIRNERERVTAFGTSVHWTGLA